MAMHEFSGFLINTYWYDNVKTTDFYNSFKAMISKFYLGYCTFLRGTGAFYCEESKLK